MAERLPPPPRWIAFALLPLWAWHHGAYTTASAASEAGRNRVAILQDEALGTDHVMADATATALRREGFEVAFLSGGAVCDPAVLAAGNYFLYVIPGAKSYPSIGRDVLSRYLESKGNLMILGAPPSGDCVWKDGQWIDRAFVRDVIAKQQPDSVAYSFEQLDKPCGWRHRTPDQKPGRVEIVPGGAQGSAGCLQITFNYGGQGPDGYFAPLKRPAGSATGGLLCFWAKGDGHTPQLAVRLVEGRGADERGIAVVRLEKQWKHYVLCSEDFRLLGQADPYKALSISFELFSRLTPQVASGPRTVWIDEIGTAPNRFASLVDTDKEALPLIETISPAYKTYPLSGIAALKIAAGQDITIAGDLALPVPASALSCYARPEGKGFQRGYQWRWIPLVKAYDKDGVERGTPIWMLLHGAPLNEGPAFADAVMRLANGIAPKPRPSREGSVCVACAITDPTALRALARTNLLGTLAKRIREGVFLSHAGAEQFAYWPGETIRLGPVAVNHAVPPAEVGVRVRVCPQDSSTVVFERETTLTLPPGQSGTTAFDWTPQGLSHQTYVVTTQLLRDRKPIDTISHGVGILSQKKASPESFITVHDGDFWLEGKKWYPVGVNYWPRYAIALECEDYVYHWLTPGFYNPEEVERDLAQLESLGANLVCIRAHHENDRRTVLDFLRRCRNHGIRVFLFLQSHVITDEPHYFQGLMMPFCFQEKAVEEFIRQTRLAENNALLGYDLIWEPAGWVFGDSVRMFGWKEPNYRQRWDADWERWIIERYGSLANAEADWGIAVPKNGDRITSPSGRLWFEDGPWRTMMAAYRRFMDDLMSRHWNDARRKLRQMDPNHLISFRQGNLPSIDFTLTATPKHVDFFTMEGYDFQPGAVGPNAAGFINRFLHFGTRGKPYFWVEFGSNVWDLASMQPTKHALAAQEESHELIYRAAWEMGAKGAAPWWWAGGYRVSEKSDFGVINPDGTLRPSGLLLQKYAALFKTPRISRQPDTWFTMDRDAHSGGLRQIAFHDGADAFQQAVAEGRMLGICTAGTGTTSADTPLVAVGNTAYNGRNPPKYLNAEFNWFKLKMGDGHWIEVANGDRIRVPRNQPITAMASVGNLQEATWLTPEHCQGKPGAVYLAGTGDSGVKLKMPIPKNTAYLEDADFAEAFLLTEGLSAETRVQLQMTADGRAWFGEKLTFTLEPVEVSP